MTAPLTLTAAQPAIPCPVTGNTECKVSLCRADGCWLRKLGYLPRGDEREESKWRKAMI